MGTIAIIDRGALSDRGVCHVYCGVVASWIQYAPVVRERVQDGSGRFAALRGMGRYSFSFYICTAGEGHGAGEEPEVEAGKMHPTWCCCSLFLFLFLFLFLLRQLPRGGGLTDFAVFSPY